MKNKNDIIQKFVKDYEKLIIDLEKTGIETIDLVSCLIEVSSIGLSTSSNLFASSDKFEEFFKNEFTTNLFKLSKDTSKLMSGKTVN